MRHHTLARLLVGLFLLIAFSVSQAQAQEQNLAQWYYAQTQWNQETLDELNFRASSAYKEITGSVVGVPVLMNRNTFYSFWPDFQNAHPGEDMSCNQGTSRIINGRPVQSYYLAYGVDTFMVAMIFHENIHSDIYPQSQEDMIYLGRPGLWSYGFETNLVADSVPLLRYFDEAYVDLLRAYIMREAGFTDFDYYGYNYQFGVEILKPVFAEIMARGATVRDLYDVQQRSDLETILTWIGIVLIEAEGLSYDPNNFESREMAVAMGWSFANKVHFAVLESRNYQAEAYVDSVESVETPTAESTESAPPVTTAQPTIVRATCGMSLWFSPEQYEQINNEFVFPPDVWSQNEWGNWLIIEEDYYPVVDRQ